MANGDNKPEEEVVVLPPVPNAHARTASEVISEVLRSPEVKTPANEIDDLAALRQSSNIVQSPSGDLIKTREPKVAPMVV